MNKAWIVLSLVSLLVPVSPLRGQGVAYYDYDPSSPTGGIRVGENLPRNELDMDLNNDGTVDFRFLGLSVFEAGFQLEPKNANRVLGYPDSDNLLTGYRAKRLLAGADIANAAEGLVAWYGYRPNPRLSVTGVYLLSCLDPGRCAGDFKPGLVSLTEGYVGIQFFAADGLHHGWIRVLGGSGNDGTILDYAYNTVPGQTITAGAVPEPSTWALLFLGAGSLWHFYRKSPKTSGPHS